MPNEGIRRLMRNERIRRLREELDNLGSSFADRLRADDILEEIDRLIENDDVGEVVNTSDGILSQIQTPEEFDFVAGTSRVTTITEEDLRNTLNSLAENSSNNIVEETRNNWYNNVIRNYISITPINFTPSNESKINNNKIMKQIINFEDNKITKTKEVDYYFPDDTHLPVTFYNNDFYCFESVEKALEFGFIEDPETMSWHKSDFNKPVLTFDKRWYSTFNNTSVQPKSKTYLLSEGKQYTFGVEYECSKLYLPRYIWEPKNLNILCMRDGSLNGGLGGPEAVTGVLNGDDGLNHLQLICKELTARGNVDKYCGMHLHCGGIDFSKENLVYLYKICLLLEDQIMQLVPKSRRNNEYCRRLDRLELTSDINTQTPYDYKMSLVTDLDLIFEYIKFKDSKSSSPSQLVFINPRGGIIEDSTKKNERLLTRKDQHPMGAKCSYKHETPRYCWVNFVPAVFNTRGKEQAKTIEIRLAPGTTMYIKTKNWLLLWMGVLWFVENKKHEIRKGLTLETILYSAYPKRGGKLLNYWNSRKELFATKEGEANDYIEEVEPIKSIKDQI